jgi:hypothetical protein
MTRLARAPGHGRTRGLFDIRHGDRRDRRPRVRSCLQTPLSTARHRRRRRRLW